MKSIRGVIYRENNKNQTFQYDLRKEKKITDTAIFLIEYLTEESNGFITAKAIKKKLQTILGLHISKQTVSKYRHKYLSD